MILTHGSKAGLKKSVTSHKARGKEYQKEGSKSNKILVEWKQLVSMNGKRNAKWAEGKTEKIK